MKRKKPIHVLVENVSIFYHDKIVEINFRFYGLGDLCENNLKATLKVSFIRQESSEF